MRSRPAESTTELMKKIPHPGRVTVWPSPSVPCGLRFLVSNFRVWPGQRRKGVQLYSVDDLVQELVGTSKAADGHNDNGE